MEREEQAQQIDDVFNGKIAVGDCHKDVQTWFELSVYNLALSIKNTKKEHRKQKIEYMKENHPEWVDDVLPIAKALITGRTT
jgi:hypothetical protein